jgi:pimeloyl-ACP methyl ester carboxylesterase
VCSSGAGCRGRRLTDDRPSLATADGLTLAGRRWPATDADAAVVLVHGFSASCEDDRVCELASAFVDQGLDVIGYTARGHGASDGDCTLGELESYDVAAAVAAARATHDKVALVGASMGAIAALRYAADADDVAGLVVISCPSRWRIPRTARGLLAAGLTRTKPGRALAARYIGVRVAPAWTTNPAPPVELAARVDAPIAVVHGTADRFVSTVHADELYLSAAEPRRLDLVEGMGHAFDPLGYATIVDGVAWTLRGSAASVPTPASASASSASAQKRI